MSESSTEQNLVAESNDTDRKEVIILNKFLNGSYLNDEANIGHEIIDVLCTDKGEIYAYNNPYGSCPDKIWVKGSKLEGGRNKKEEYVAKYLVLTSEQNGKKIYIRYVIKLAEKLHRKSRPTTSAIEKNKKANKALKDAQEDIVDIIKKREIKYNGKPLNEIYKNDKTLYVTFKAETIYEPNKEISITLEDYNYQRNKGYLYSDKSPRDFRKVMDEITNMRNFHEFKPSKVNSNEKSDKKSKTFIDLIMKEYDEQIYTNILFSILKDGGLFKAFCKYCMEEDQKFDETNPFNVFREYPVKEGRIDICGESDNQRVVIENKILSGLHGIQNEDHSQLRTYYDWAKDKKQEPLCFILVPDRNKQYIEGEIEKHDRNSGMKDIYRIVTYKKIAEFLKENKEYLETNGYIYYSLVDQIINAFENLSKSQAELYVQMFTRATK